MTRNMETHVNLVGWLHIALGVLGLIMAGIVFVVIAGGGLISGDAEAIVITSTVATIIAFFIAVLSVPGIIAGIGVLRRYSWARYLAIILGFLNLLNFPIGTAIGAYTIWALLQEESTPLFQ